MNNEKWSWPTVRQLCDELLEERGDTCYSDSLRRQLEQYWEMGRRNQITLETQRQVGLFLHEYMPLPGENASLREMWARTVYHVLQFSARPK